LFSELHNLERQMSNADGRKEKIALEPKTIQTNVLLNLSVYGVDSYAINK